MTESQARAIIKEILTSKNPKIKDFNEAIMRKIVLDRLRKAALKKAGPYGAFILVITADSWQEACIDGLGSMIGGIGDLH